jgi:hypothetical protein
MSYLEEMQSQAEAFRRMNGDLIELIAKHAEEFRAIIDDYEAMHDRAPTANDLLWIASEHAGEDITKTKG